MADGTERDVAALQALRDRMDEDTDAERDEDLGVYFETAWPTSESQNN